MSECFIAGVNKDVDLLEGVEKARALHKSRKRVGADREKETLAKLMNFKSGSLKGAAEDSKDSEESGKKADFTHVGSYGWQEALDDYDDSDWLTVGTRHAFIHIFCVEFVLIVLNYCCRAEGSSSKKKARLASFSVGWRKTTRLLPTILSQTSAPRRRESTCLIPKMVSSCV